MIVGSFLFIWKGIFFLGGSLLRIEGIYLGFWRDLRSNLLDVISGLD